MVQQLCKDVDPVSLHDFLAFIRPYSLPGDTAPMVLEAPRLSSISLDEAEKVKKYGKMLVDNLLVPKIMLGEPGKNSLVKLLELLQKPWQEHLLLSLPDSIVSLTGDILDVVDTILACVRFDRFDQLGAINAVDRVRKMFRSSSGEPLSLLATAIGENGYWMDRVFSFVQITSSIKVHKSQIDDVNEYLNAPNPEKESVNEMAAKLVGVAKDLQYLSEELSPEAVEKMLKGGIAKVEHFWTLVLEEYEKHGFQNINVEELQSTVAEASMAFPNEESIQGYRGKLNKMLALKSGEEKMDLMLTAFFALHKLIMNGKPLEVEQLSVFLQHAQAAQGVQLPLSKKEEFELALGELPTKAVEIMKRDLDEAKKFQTVLSSCMSWAASTFKETMVDRLSMMMDLMISLKAYIGSPEERDVQAWLVNDEGKTKLASLMSAKVAASKVGDQDWWGQNYLVEKMKVVEDVIEKSKTMILKKSVDALMEKLALLEPMAGGNTDGKLWTEGLKNLNDWNMLQKHAQSNLLKVPAPELNQHMDAVEEADLQF